MTANLVLKVTLNEIYILVLHAICTEKRVILVNQEIHEKS